ncbi:acetylcholine receptor subunit beta-type acr-3-like, partial [Pecten maximus]|uniref:acetylcholine receptor subunit beta-type acr-3-like n=1 Tax=Pecten maximus TaxID=6579 RepID=UPI001458388D
MPFKTGISVSLVLLVLSCISDITCSAANKETELLEHLFTGYNTHARPVTNSSSPVVVDVSFFISSYEIAEETQELLTIGWFSLTWKNELLAWNVSEYPVSHIVVSPSMVWLPSVTVINSNDDRNGILKSISSVQIFSDGLMAWWPDAAMKTSCMITIKKYPFDEQKCTIHIIAWLRSAAEQQFISSADHITITSDELNTEWEYLGSSIQVETNENGQLSSVKFDLKVKRRPFYQIVHTLIPIILLSYMNCFIFIIPINSGENTSFGVAIFLAFAVFIGPVKESLPVTSTETCILTVYLIVQFCVGGLETCLSSITLRLASRTTQVPVNSWWIKLVNISFLIKQQKRKVFPELSPSDTQIIIEKYTKENGKGDESKAQVIGTLALPSSDVDLSEDISTFARPLRDVDLDWTARE